MNALTDIKNIFFLGIGGIGMSALARYFHHSGYHVSGYDRTPSPLTHELEQEGIAVTYEDNYDQVKTSLKPRNNSLVVRTPAVPDDSVLLNYFREQGYDIRKRSEVLGLVTRSKKALCVAGTHGKTTTSTMLAYLLSGEQAANGEGNDGVNAFLGGISMNYGTNVLIDKKSEYVVVEADEYDRSFHQLTPYISVVTAVDPDHLDIYGTPEAYREAFAHYTSLITGALVMKKGIELVPRLQPGVKCYTYGMENAGNIRVTEGRIVFDYSSPLATIKDITLGVPVWVNIENAVAAITVALLIGVSEERIKERVASFKGVQRRFNIHINTPRLAYIDDYAHHPQEIATAIDSIRKLFPQRRLIGVFQPHLYTRTRDFAEGFKRVLGTLDECILLPIYPAREEPIEGVTSEMLGGQVIEKKDLVQVLRDKVQSTKEPVVILTVGAGDIDRLVQPIADALR
jgi:UDP-N-acetylmuramate--alanine ligase